MKKLMVFFLLTFWIQNSYSQLWQTMGKGLPEADVAFAEQFGRSISLDGNAVLVGVPGNDDEISNAGKAIIYEKVAGSWVKKAELLPGIEENSSFGLSVLLKGNYAYVGAPNYLSGKGIVYVYKKTGTSWDVYITIDILSPDELMENSLFGSSISISGNILAVGAPGMNGAASGSGVVYVFDLIDNLFQFRKKVFPAAGNPIDRFGKALSFNDDHLFVGSPFYNVSGINKGSVFVYDDLNFNQIAQLTSSSNTNLGFGEVISASNTEIAVSTQFGENSNGTFGSVLIFLKDGATWLSSNEDFTFIPNSPPLSEYGLYGTSLSLKGDYLLVGNGSGTRVDLLKKAAAGWGAATLVKTFNETGLVFQNQYGASVAMSDTDILIGAYNLNQINEFSGKIFSYQKNGVEWTNPIKLTDINGVSINAGLDQFGNSIDIFGNYAIAGAPHTDVYAENSGAAYIFEFDGVSWKRIARLTPSSGGFEHYFGYSVSISENRAVVSATGADYNGSNSGVVYVYEKPASGWKSASETTKINRIDYAKVGDFGFRVKTISDEIVISHYELGGTDLIGDVYIFSKSGDTWLLKATLSPKNKTSIEADAFGASLAYNGNTLLVGAPFAGEQRKGHVLVFEKPTTGWINANQVALLSPSDPTIFGYFGTSVGLSENTAIVGCPYVDGKKGAAYIFEKGSQWKDATENAKLSNTLTLTKQLGWSVAISGDIAIASTPDESKYGVVLIFKKQDGIWKNTVYYDEINTGLFSDEFGHAVAVSGDHLIVSAPSANTSAGGSSGEVEFFIKQPTILKVTSSSTNGTYFIGQSINAKVIFSQSVSITGNPTLELLMYNNDTRMANFVNLTSGNEANFNYVVQAGDSTPKLNYKDAQSLKGTFSVSSKINNSQGFTILPDPSSPNSLGAQKNIVIDGIIQIPVVGINELTNEIFSVYPNPFIATVRINGEDITRYAIFDSRGVLIERRLFSDGSIELSHLPDGYFLLELETTKGVKRVRLVKSE
jgi:hypothetical protein